MIRVAALLLCCLGLAACGSKSTHAPATTATTSPAVPPTTTREGATTTTAPSASPGALQAEAASTAAGDIPDNQVFVVYPGTSFTMRYPEGWAQSGGGDKVTFRDKNNIVRIVLVPGAPPTAASLQKELAALKNVKPGAGPATLKIGGVPAVKATYETTSARNAVTGKTVTLTVDRYELAKNGKRAIVDLGSPVGVDNVDAYRLMIQSLRIK